MAKKNQYKQAYLKERRRIQSFMNKHRKEGFIFPENTLPAIPKKITKGSIRRLQKITPKKLYQKSRYGGELSFGEIISGKEARELKKIVKINKIKQSKKKSQTEKELKKASQRRQSKKTAIKVAPEDTFTEIVITNFLGLIDMINPHAGNKMKRWLNDIIERRSRKEVAEMLQKASENGVSWEPQYAYKEELLNQYLTRLLDYLPELGTLERDEITDAIELDEYYEDYEEY